MGVYLGKLRCVIVLILILIFSGCSWNHGGLKSNKVLLSQSDSQTLPTQLNYYYCGRANLPYAVVGIDRSWNFDGKFWIKAKDMAHVYYLINHLSDLNPHVGKVMASDILGPGGDHLGIWFSRYHHTPIKVDKENKKVRVSNPYNPNEGSGYNRLSSP